ncbi:MAG: TIGR03862 family flavoprotein [Pseudomonadota bacterium]
MQNTKPHHKKVVVIGGGPAGLMAAEVIAQAGYDVSIYDAMPSLGRKFLLAGVGGMNITHSELHEKLLGRYAQASSHLKPCLDAFCANKLCEWIHGLGIETFIGSSGRIFPSDMKAAPLLRAWLHRLRELRVKIYPRHRWLGWVDSASALDTAQYAIANSALRFNGVVDGKEIAINVYANAVVLALGGASWQRLGSDGTWVNLLRNKDIKVADLLPSNCGFEVQWSELLQSQFSGQPLLTVNLSVTTLANELRSIRGEAVITKTGIEGTSIYALSASIRELILARNEANLHIDLLPDTDIDKIIAQLNKPRGKNSMTNFLRKQLNLSPVKLALLRELTPASIWQDTLALAQAIKSLRLTLNGFRPIDEAISTAGGVKFNELSSHLMLNNLPGIFCAGEMLDWEAPTGGYLLTACFATGRAAGLGVVEYLKDEMLVL